MKKIVIVINSSWAAYNFRFNLALKLKEENYNVTFLAPYDSKYSELIKEEFDFINLSINASGINPIEDFNTMFNLRRILKRLNADILLNFSIKPNIYGSIVARLLNIYSINNISGLGTLFIKKTFLTKVAKLLYKISLCCSTKTFFQNRDDLTLFIDNNLINIDKSDLLPGSGVDLTKFIPEKNNIKKDKLIFLMVSRLIKDKGVLEFIDAAKIIKKKYDNVEFQILGETGVLNKTAISKNELNKWIKDDLINYLGNTDNVKTFLTNADCIVLPSYREGTPRSLLEAAAMEKPIITTNVPGCKEVVANNINGYLCEVKNPKDLALKIEKMITLTHEERIVMGKEGRKKMLKQFDENIVINKYLDVIKDTLK